MKITGQILKENRERKNITLSEVSLSTKITVKTLVAIEDGDAQNLPPKTFLRGFVRSYAQYLGLDVEEILKIFQEEMGSTLSRPAGPADLSPSEMNSTATESVAAAASRPTDSSGREKRDWLDRFLSVFPRHASRARDPHAALNNETSMATKVFVVIAVGSLLALILFFKAKMDRYEEERVSAESAAVGSSDNSMLPAEPTPGEPIIDESKPSETPPETRVDVAATPTPTPKPSATPTPTPKPSATPTPTTSSEVLIEALDNVEIEAALDGEPGKLIRLKADQVQSIKLRRKGVLKVSDGGAVNLIVNGVDRGVPGDLGKPARVELP